MPNADLRTSKRGDRMKDYRAQTPASKPPVLPLSAQMRVAAEMAAPEIRGLAEMIGTEWQAEALRLEGAVAAARAEQREATIRHAAEFLDTLGRSDLGRALTRALGGQ